MAINVGGCIALQDVGDASPKTMISSDNQLAFQILSEFIQT